MMRMSPVWALILACFAGVASAGQAPGRLNAPDIPISHRDRVYAAEQFSNTVSVIDPASNQLLGVIRLGEPSPTNFSPLYRGQVLVHGMGFSPDHRTLAVVSIGSNAVTFIDTATNAIKHTTYLGRAPHEAFFTPDGRHLWVTIRGENYVSILSSSSFQEQARITLHNGPGMQIFSPDGHYAYVCSSFTPETDIFTTEPPKLVGRVTQASPFCPNIAASPDGAQVWFTLKDTGRVQVFAARPPFALLKTLNTGPITNHVNFVAGTKGVLAYVTVGGLNEVQVYRTTDFAKIATIHVGDLPHGIWPSGDGSRVYVGLENADEMLAIDTATNKIVATIPIGQAPQAVVYVPDAVPSGDGKAGLQPLNVAGGGSHFSLVSTSVSPGAAKQAPTSVTLFDQGLVQVLEASATGLAPKSPYVLALAAAPDGGGTLQPLASFTTNAAGAAIVNTIGPIRQIIHDGLGSPRLFFVIAPGTVAASQPAAQVQTP